MHIALPIQSTFDIAVARNKVRKTAEANNWPPIFRARVSAALTVLAELALFAPYPQIHCLLLNIKMIELNGRQGIEMECETYLNAAREKLSTDLTHLQLKRASDEFEIREGISGEHIMLRIWAN